MESLTLTSSIFRKHTKETIINVSSISGAVFNFFYCFLSLVSFSFAPLFVNYLFCILSFLFVWIFSLSGFGTIYQGFNQ
jgi:hypothetical protein